MSTLAKQRLAQVVYVVGFVCLAFCLSRMVGPGMAGDIATVRFWAILAAAILLVTLPAALAYYYYRARPKESDNSRAAIKALSAAGANLAKQKACKK